jgi:hypothetical protein
MDPKIADFIRTNRGRYTREAITQRLVEAGHAREEVDWTWDRLAEGEPMTGPAGTNMAPYVWIAFGLGGLVIVYFIVTAYFNPILMGWLLAYVLLALWPALWLSRQRPSSTGGVVAIVVAAPLIFVLIGGGICLATIAVIFGSLGGA